MRTESEGEKERLDAMKMHAYDSLHKLLRFLFAFKMDREVKDFSWIERLRIFHGLIVQRLKKIVSVVTVG